MTESLTLKPQPKITSKSIVEIVTNGLLFDPKNWQTSMSTPNSNQLLATIQRLFKTLAEKELSYVLVGGVAMLGYIEGRNTQDVNLIMARADGIAAGLVLQVENQDFAQADFEGLRVDLLLTQNKVFRMIQTSHVQEVQFGEDRIVSATPEGLVILKFYALPSLYRQGEFNRAALYETDILQLALNYPLSLENLLQIVKPYVLKSDFNELSEIMIDIQSRIKRMQRTDR